MNSLSLSIDPRSFSENCGLCQACGTQLASLSTWSRHINRNCDHFKRKFGVNISDIKVNKGNEIMKNEPLVCDQKNELQFSNQKNNETQRNDQTEKRKRKQNPIKSSTPRTTKDKRVKADIALLQKNVKPCPPGVLQQDTFNRALNIIKAIGTDDQLENVVLKLGNGKFLLSIVKSKVTEFEQSLSTATHFLAFQENENLSDRFMRRMRQFFCYTFDPKTKTHKRREIFEGVHFPLLPSVEKLKSLSDSYQINCIYPIFKGLILLFFKKEGRKRKRKRRNLLIFFKKKKLKEKK